MKQIKIFKYIFLIFCINIFFNSCSKKQPAEQKSVNFSDDFLEVKAQDHSWYYFTQEGFSKVDKPQYAASNSLIPWTEACRISSANSCMNDGENSEKGFAIVNRLGVLCFENDKITLSKDSYIFDDRTAGNLIFIDNKPVFSVYKSSFFNESTQDKIYQNDNSKHLFLVQYDDSTKVSYPIINCNNFVEETNSEVTDFFWNGKTWVCSIKTIMEDKTCFSYINWTNTVPLLSLTPDNASEGILITKIDFDTYKAQHTIQPYSQAPQRIKALLENFSEKKSFSIDVKSAGGYSIRKYENTVETKDPSLSAKGLLSQNWSAVLFQDGTFFLEGALAGKHILRNGKPIALRLPKLPPNYIYSDFVISGTSLYAAWEETKFYKTSKSGFISIDLDKILY